MIDTKQMREFCRLLIGFDATIPLRLNARDIEVPGEIVACAEDVTKAIAGAAKNGEILGFDKGRYADQVKKLIHWIDLYMSIQCRPGKPWDDGEKEIALVDVRKPGNPRGNCDGIIFLNGIHDTEYKFAVQSAQKEAFRYLKAGDPLVCFEMKSPAGLASIDFNSLCKHCVSFRDHRDEIRNARRRPGEEIHVFFALTRAGINAVQPEHCDRWIVKKSESEGVWCVLYI